MGEMCECMTSWWCHNNVIYSCISLQHMINKIGLYLYNCCIWIFITVIIFLQNWEIIHKPLGEYPVGRYGQAATVISGCVQEILITIGGRGSEGMLNEYWMMDISRKKYKKVFTLNLIIITWWSCDTLYLIFFIILNLYMMICLQCQHNLKTVVWSVRSIHISTIM